MNFIKSKIIKKLEKEIKKRQVSYSHIGFFYLNNPILFKELNINRLNDYYVYEHDKILPKKFSVLSGDLLLKILKSILNEEFHLFKIINGKKYKIKMKKDDTIKQID